MTWLPRAGYPILLLVGTLAQWIWIGVVVAAIVWLWERRPHPPATRYLVGLAGLLLSLALSVLAAIALHRSMFGQAVAVEASRRGAPGGGLAGIVGQFGNQVAAVAFAVWLLGLVAGLLRLAAGAMALGRRLRQAVPSGRGARAAVAAAGPLPPRLEVRESIRDGSPFVAGLARPILVLPPWSFLELEGEEFASVVRHELAHVKRHDFLVNLVQQVIETLGWCNPGLLLLSRRVRAAREECCDEAAVAGGSHPLAMATALLRLEEARNTRIFLASALGGSDDLGQRVRRLVAPPERGLARWSWSAAAAVVLGLGVSAGIAGDRAGAVVRWSMPVATVHAIDPAGTFAIAMLGGRMLAAWMPNGRPRVVQHGHLAQLVDERGATVIAFTMKVGGFRWEPRSSPP